MSNPTPAFDPENVKEEDEVFEDEDVCEMCGGSGLVVAGEHDDHITKKCPECSFEDMSGSSNEDR